MKTQIKNTTLISQVSQQIPVLVQKLIDQSSKASWIIEKLTHVPPLFYEDKFITDVLKKKLTFTINFLLIDVHW